MGVPYFWKDFPSTTVKNQNWVSPSTHHHKSQQPLLNHTTPSCQLTHFWSTLMSPLCWITKPSTISAEDNWTSRDQPTLTWSHTQESISCCHHMLQSSQLKRPTTNNCQLL